VVLLYHRGAGRYQADVCTEPGRGIGMKLQRHNEGQWSKMREGLRTKAMQILGLFSRKPSPDSATPSAENTKQSFAFSDPTTVLFPDNTDDDDAPGVTPLRILLEESAHNSVMRARALESRADLLVSRIADRAQGEITLATQWVRFVIGGLWLLTAIWLYFTSTGALSGDLSALSSGVTLEDARILALTFLPIGLAGIGVAVAAVALVAATGNGANTKVRREANDLGIFIADTAQDFDRDLTRLREEMNRRANPADAVIDLSRAHLTALEATVYFREISFISGTEGEEARLRFRKFLSRPTPASALEAFVIGFLLGAIVIAYLYVPRPEVAVRVLPDIAKYPWASNLLLFGGIFYASAGVILSLIGGALSANATTKARSDALDALRGAFTAREAPRPVDVIRRIEDAVDVFRARVGGRREKTGGDQRSASQFGCASSGQHNTNFADNMDDQDIPSWRRRDTSARFVDTDFQAAPDTFRTDAYAKKIEADRAGKTGSKRGLFKLKNPPRD